MQKSSQEFEKKGDRSRNGWKVERRNVERPSGGLGSAASRGLTKTHFSHLWQWLDLQAFFRMCGRERTQRRPSKQVKRYRGKRATWWLVSPARAREKQGLGGKRKQESGEDGAP